MQKLINKVTTIIDELTAARDEMAAQFQNMASMFTGTAPVTVAKRGRPAKVAKTKVAKAPKADRSAAMKAAWEKRRANGTATRKAKAEAKTEVKVKAAKVSVKRKVEAPAAPVPNRRIRVLTKAPSNGAQTDASASTAPAAPQA
jgi:hypothetical protein